MQTQQPQWGNPNGIDAQQQPAYGYVVGGGGTNASQLASQPQYAVGGNPAKGGAYYYDDTNTQPQNKNLQQQNPYFTNSAQAGGDVGAGGGGALQGIPLYGGDALSEGGAPVDEKITKKFVVQGWKDVWAAVLFTICAVGCVGLGCYNFNQSFKDFSSINAADGTPVENVDGSAARNDVAISGGMLVGLLVGMVVFSAVLATISLLLFSKFPKEAIIGANVITIVIMLISSAVSFVLGSVFSGVFTLIIAIANAAILYFYRSRIPFSALLLKVCSGIAMKYKGLIVANFGLVGAFSVFTIFWSSAIYPSVYRMNENNGTANGGDVGIFFFATFVYFWASQVAFNVMHVTSSGVTATWYFVGGDARMPRNPTVSSFRRAVTTSFGSICFGSLLVAILEFLRYVVRSQRENENEYVACIVECILGCLERLVEYFNHFAFVYCAIYGYDYLTAAKKTFALAQNCAFAAVFNESLVNTTLTITSLAAAAVAFLLFWGTINMAVGIIAGVISLFVHIQLFRIIDSATTTMFVCFAEEPHTLAAVNSELYERIYAANSGNAAGAHV